MISKFGSQLKGLTLKESDYKPNMSDEEKKAFYESHTTQNKRDVCRFSSKMCDTVKCWITFFESKYTVYLQIDGRCVKDTLLFLLSFEATGQYKNGKFNIQDAKSILDSEIQQLINLLTSNMKFVNLEDIEIQCVLKPNNRDGLKDTVFNIFKNLMMSKGQLIQKALEGYFTVPDIKVEVEIPHNKEEFAFNSSVKEKEYDLYEELVNAFPKEHIPKIFRILQTDFYYLTDMVAKCGSDRLIFVGKEFPTKIDYYKQLKEKLTTQNLAEATTDDLFATTEEPVEEFETRLIEDDDYDYDDNAEFETRLIEEFETRPIEDDEDEEFETPPVEDFTEAQKEDIQEEDGVNGEDIPIEDILDDEDLEIYTSEVEKVVSEIIQILQTIHGNYNTEPALGVVGYMDMANFANTAQYKKLSSASKTYHIRSGFKENERPYVFYSIDLGIKPIIDNKKYTQFRGSMETLIDTLRQQEYLLRPQQVYPDDTGAEMFDRIYDIQSNTFTCDYLPAFHSFLCRGRLPWNYSKKYKNFTELSKDLKTKITEFCKVVFKFRIEQRKPMNLDETTKFLRDLRFLLTNVFIVKAITPFSVNFTLRAYNSSKNPFNVSQEICDKCLFNQYDDLASGGDSSVAKYSIISNNVTNIMLVKSQKRFCGETLFGYELLLDALAENGTLSLGKVPIGKRIDGGIVYWQLQRDLKNSVPITIRAGGRSGKGVLTQLLMGVFMGCGVPFVYLDGKPEMSLTVWETNKKYGTKLLATDIGSPDRAPEAQGREVATNTLLRDFAEFKDNKTKFLTSLPFVRLFNLYLAVVLARKDRPENLHKGRIVLIWDEVNGAVQNTLLPAIEELQELLKDCEKLQSNKMKDKKDKNGNIIQKGETLNIKDRQVTLEDLIYLRSVLERTLSMYKSITKDIKYMGSVCPQFDAGIVLIGQELTAGEIQDPYGSLKTDYLRSKVSLLGKGMTADKITSSSVNRVEADADYADFITGQSVGLFDYRTGTDKTENQIFKSAVVLGEASFEGLNLDGDSIEFSSESEAQKNVGGLLQNVWAVADQEVAQDLFKNKMKVTNELNARLREVAPNFDTLPVGEMNPLILFDGIVRLIQSVTNCDYSKVNFLYEDIELMMKTVGLLDNGSIVDYLFGEVSYSGESIRQSFKSKARLESVRDEDVIYGGDITPIDNNLFKFSDFDGSTPTQTSQPTTPTQTSQPTTPTQTSKPSTPSQPTQTKSTTPTTPSSKDRELTDEQIKKEEQAYTDIVDDYIYGKGKKADKIEDKAIDELAGEFDDKVADVRTSVADKVDNAKNRAEERQQKLEQEFSASSSEARTIAEQQRIIAQMEEHINRLNRELNKGNSTRVQSTTQHNYQANPDGTNTWAITGYGKGETYQKSIPLSFIDDATSSGLGTFLAQGGGLGLRNLLKKRTNLLVQKISQELGQPTSVIKKIVIRDNALIIRGMVIVGNANNCGNIYDYIDLELFLKKFPNLKYLGFDTEAFTELVVYEGGTIGNLFSTNSGLQTVAVNNTEYLRDGRTVGSGYDTTQLNALQRFGEYCFGEPARTNKDYLSRKNMREQERREKYEKKLAEKQSKAEAKEKAKAKKKAHLTELGLSEIREGKVASGIVHLLRGRQKK